MQEASAPDTRQTISLLMALVQTAAAIVAAVASVIDIWI
jgi:hypothetical protein